MAKDKTQEAVEMTQISTTDLGEVLADNKAMKKRLEILENKGILDVDEEVTHTCNVKLFDGKPISRMFDVHTTGIDPITRDEVSECKLEVVNEDDTTSVVEADYLEVIRNAESVVAEIVKVDKIDVSPKTTKTVGVNVVEGYNTVATGVLVPLKVKTFQPVFIVKLPSGREVKLSSVNL